MPAGGGGGGAGRPGELDRAGAQDRQRPGARRPRRRRGGRPGARAGAPGDDPQMDPGRREHAGQPPGETRSALMLSGWLTVDSRQLTAEDSLTTEATEGTEGRG